MKKALIYIILFLASTSAFAQKDAQATAILKQMSLKYRALNPIKADFTLTVDNPQAGAKQTQTGTLIANSKTGKFKVTLMATGSKTDEEQEIISDGKTQWTYLKKDKEVQVNNAGKEDDEMNPAKLFTFYEHGYKYVYNGDQRVDGKLCQVIDLSPEEAGKPFFKIRLMIDKVKKEIYSATLFDNGGGHFTYTINSLSPKTPAPESTFTFDKKDHPGVEVVDLR